MPITIDWLNEKQNTLHLKFSKPWTWDEYYPVSAKGFEMTDSVSHRVNIIMDFSDSGGMLPPSALTHFKKAAEKAHPRRGAIVFVSKHMMLTKSLANVVQKVTKMKTALLFADTLDEAKNIIAHLIEDKPDTLPLR